LVLLSCGFLILFKFIRFPEFDHEPEDHTNSSTPDLTPSRDKIVNSNDWIPTVFSVGVIFLLNMICVSAFSPGVLLYLYNGPTVTVLGHEMNTQLYFALFSSFGFLSDVVSRRIVYKRNFSFHPIRFLLFSFIGLWIILGRVPVIAPLGTLLIFYANGSVYALSSKWLDSKIPNSSLVVANSFFFLFGDIGSVIGAVSIPFIRDFLATS
jgi:hypothetical protein